MEKPIGIGMIGCGTVGSGVVKLLVEQRQVYAQRVGRPIEIRKVLVREQDKHYKTEQVPVGCLIHDADAFFNTPDMDVVLELAGGKGVALEFVKRALQAGKHVVTANKALLAAHGRELFQLARKHKVSIAFEASCGGGIPIITAMQFNLISNQIQSMYGILNGTCNYILTQMTSHGTAYSDALAAAQKAGFAEADPTLDVTGGDTAHKLAILSSLAFSAAVTDEAFAVEGIDKLNIADIRFGAELGYTLKLLAIGERQEAGLSLSVGPCFIHDRDLLAHVDSSFNAVSVFGDAVGHTFFYGRGAGQMPTASAVVGDMMNIVSSAYGEAFAKLRIWPDQQEEAVLMDPDQLASRYYLRINMLDEPGVVAKFTTILGNLGISIASVLQHEMDAGKFVPVVVITHRTTAGAVRNASAKIAQQPEFQGEPVCIRIVDMPEG